MKKTVEQFEAKANILWKGKYAQSSRFQNAVQCQEETMQGKYGISFGQNPANTSPGPFNPGKPGGLEPPPQPVPSIPQGSGGGYGGKKSDYPHFEPSNLARIYAYDLAQQDIFYPDTLLWHPDLVLENGNGVISFDLPPYASAYKIIVIGHDAHGRLGYAESSFEVKAK
jgi:hypothetical protein